MKSNFQKFSAYNFGVLVASTMCACGPGSSQPSAVNDVQQAWFEDNGPGLDGIRQEWNVVGFKERPGLFGFLQGLTHSILQAYLPGARLLAVTSSDDDATLPARIVAASPSAEAPDRVAYRITVDVAGRSQPLCGTDATGSPVLAIRLPGTWDHRSGVPGGGDHEANDEQFTLACQGSTLEKCAQLYSSWTSTRAAAAFQTCTRALRADYCGDGTPHTSPGVRIDIKDRLGREFDPGSISWTNEAVWGEQGAGCLAYPRAAAKVPDCFARIQSPSCMDPPVFNDPNMQLMTRVAPNE